MKYKYLILPTAYGISFLFSQTSYAQSTSMGIYPPVTRITAQPQTEVSIPLRISNKSDTEKLVTLSFLGFRPSSNKSQTHEYYLNESTPHDLSSLIKTIKIYDKEDQIKSLRLFPQETKELRLTFITPNKEGSDFYFSPMFTYLDALNEQNKDTTIQIAQSIGSNILLSVEPTRKAQTIVSEFSTSPVIISGPINVSFRLTNESPNFSTVNGTIDVYNFSGRKVFSQKVPETIILGKSSKSVTDSNSSHLQINGSFTGLYTIQTQLQINNEPSITKQTHVLYIPFVYVLVVVVVMFVALSIGYKILKRLQFKKASQS